MIIFPILSSFLLSSTLTNIFLHPPSTLRSYRILGTLQRREQGSIDLPTARRVEGVLTSISEEIDSPLFYHLPELASTVHSPVPLFQDMYSALKNLGYECSQFHHQPDSLKTNAPDYIVWDIIREFVRKKQPDNSRSKNLSEIAIKILNKQIRSDVNFNYVSRNLIKRKGLNRYGPNPEANWGPKKRGLKGKK